MRAISIRQPWAYAICRLGKRIENRTWAAAPSYRGLLLIHAAKGATLAELNDAWYWMYENRLTTEVPDDATALKRGARGAYVAIADLVDARRYTGREDRGSDPWAIEGQTHLVLANVREFHDPIPAKGMLGLFNPTDADANEIRWRLAKGLFSLRESTD